MMKFLSQSHSGRCRSYHAGFSEADDQALSTENALWFDAIPPFNGACEHPTVLLETFH